MIWGFWRVTQDQFSQICQEYDVGPLQPTPEPYTRSLTFLDALSTTIVSYLSNANLHVPTDTWLEDPEQGNKAAERDLLVDALDSEASAVSAMKDMAKLMQKTSRYMISKVVLGRAMVAEFNQFRDLEHTLNNLTNRVIRGALTKTEALQKVEAVLDAISALATKMQEFYTSEPGEDEYRGIQLLFGQNPFLTGLLDGDVDDCMMLASEDNPLLALRVNENINSRDDIPLLQQGYAAAMQLFADIKGIRNEEEELARQVARLVDNLNRDIQEIVEEVYNDEPTETSPSVLADTVRQVEELKKRMTAVTSMTDRAVIFERVVVETRTDSLNMSADEFFKKARRKLLAQKDIVQDTKRAQQDREKTVLQEVLKTFPKVRLTPLNSRRDIVPWIGRFQSVKSTLKTSGIADWKIQLLNMGRESLKMEADKVATKYMDSLGEFETYMADTYVSGLNLIEDLLSELTKKDMPSNASQSIANIQETLVVMKTIKKKKLGPKFTERHFEMLLKVTLTRKDRDEFRNEHAREKVENRMASSTVLTVDEGAADEVDWDKTMAEEVEVTSLDARREFLTRFLERKLVQLKDLQTSMRILGEDVEKRKFPKLGMKKVQFGERAFIMKEFVESDYDEEELSEIEEVSQTVFAAMEKGKNNLAKGKQKEQKSKDKKYEKKPCPIKCSKGTHSNGSLFFCDAYRMKSKEERRSLQKKTHVCSTCLSRVGQNHVCPVGSCAACGAGHNILLCPREKDDCENVRLGADGNNTDSDPESEYTEDENMYEKNSSEQVFLVKKSNPKTSTPKSSEKNGSKDCGIKKKAKSVSLQQLVDIRKNKINEQKQEVNSDKARKHAKDVEVAEMKEKERLSEVKNFLKELVEKIPKDTKVFPTCSAEMANLEREENIFSERVCFVQCEAIEEEGYEYEGIFEVKDKSGSTSDSESDSERDENEISSDATEAEINIESSEDDDYKYSNEDYSGIESSQQSDTPSIVEEETPFVESNSFDSNVSNKYNINKSISSFVNNVEINDGDKPNLVSSSEADSSDSEDSDSNVDKDIDNGVFLVTSITNLRRRHIFGLETSFEDRKKALSKAAKKKEEHSNNDEASLQEIQDMLKESLNEDERNIKRRFPKKSIFSEEKWEKTGRWEEVIEEGKKGYDGFNDQVRLLYTPGTKPINLPEPDLPTGFTKTIYGAKDGGVIFDELLKTAIKAYEIVSAKGRNMSSMVTPVTLMGSKETVNPQLASQLKIPWQEIDTDIILEIEGVCDTGADTGVCDKNIRDILGREPLADAASDLQGCTGKDGNRNQDKIRIVTSNKEVSLVEARTVESLGTGAPDSQEFIEAVVQEINIKDQYKDFHFAETMTKPRLLVGLKNGDLLSSMLHEGELMEKGFEIPMFSPNLKIWRTSLNDKYLVTGNIGCNPSLVESANNYPRFSIIKKEGESEDKTLQKVIQKGKRLLESIANIPNRKPACFHTKDLVFHENCENKGQVSSTEISNLLVNQEAETGPTNAISRAKIHDKIIRGGPEIALQNQNCLSCGIITDWAPPEFVEENSRILIKDNNEVLIYSSIDDSDSWYDRHVGPTSVYYSKSDSVKLEKFFQAENSLSNVVKRKCLLHSSRCETCEILNRQNHRREGNLISTIWDNITAHPVAEGKFQIVHKYTYRHNPEVTYAPANSNVKEAASHSRKVIRKAKGNGSLHLLETQVQKMIDKRSFVELNAEEILELGSKPHLFCFYNYVVNSNSASTPYRMISNTSNVSSETTISVEQLSPQQILNPQESGLVRFCLFAVPLAADVKSAYHTIAVDFQSSFLRLFMWWADLPTCTQTRIFRQVTQSFGDTSAAIGLEIGIIKFVAAVAVLAVTKFLLEFSRYADNIMYSTETREEYLEIKEDLNKSFNMYSMDLKYVITSMEHDPKVLEDKGRGDDPIERLLGLNWDLRSDTILAKPRYNLFGTARGALLGPNLEDMSDEDIMKAPLSRLTFLRLTAQGYNKLQNLLGPLITSTKALASRSCELASTSELELDLSERDPQFIQFARKFIINLKKVNNIIPFRRAWVPLKHKLGGFVVSLDGGKLAFGTAIHSIAVPLEADALDRSLVTCKSKISKRNVPAHEALSGKLGADALEQILQPLLFDFSLKPLVFYYLLDSTCTLAMLNPRLDLKNVLLANAVSSFKEKIVEISIVFPNSVGKIGYIEGSVNPSDGMTKLFPDPVSIINSSLYRHGPKKFESFETLDQDLVARVENGSFYFLGIPRKFMPEAKSVLPETEEKCYFCHLDTCGVAMTRAQARRLWMEEETEDICGDMTKGGKTSVKSVDPDIENIGSNQSRELTKWLSRTNHTLTLTAGDNLLDPRYISKCNLVLGKEQYLKLLGKMFKLEQLFRTFVFLVSIYWARTMPGETQFEVKKEAFLCLLRTSQAHFSGDLEKLCDTEVQGVRGMSLRLAMRHARAVFSAQILPVICSKDPVTTKFIRMKHQLGMDIVRPAHFNMKTTNQLLTRGQVGVTWYKKRLMIKQFLQECGICNKFKNCKARPRLGNSLVRITLPTLPWQNVSIDPLGYMRITVYGSNTIKVYPLIIADINTGAICFELLEKLEAREVFLALSRVEYRFSISIVQILSDDGSQLQAHLLGDRKNFYQKKLSARWGVHNNVPHSQHRNMAERKVQSAKRLVKQSLEGVPGPIKDPMSRSMLETVLTMSANMVNNTPYLTEDNEHLLAPADLISPWRACEQGVRQIPASGLKTLESTRRYLMVKRAALISMQTDELADELRFKQGRMKLGSNKNALTVGIGSMVMVWLDQRPELGVVTELDGGECTLRLRHRSLRTTVAVVTPVSSSNPEKHLKAMEITHFISLELKNNQLKDKVADLQIQLKEIEGIGKPTRLANLHLTLAVLEVPADSLEDVCGRTERAVAKFKDAMDGSKGFLVTTSAIKFLDHGSLSMGIGLGAELCEMARVFIEEELKTYIADIRFSPHLTIFTQNVMEQEERDLLSTSLAHTQTGSLVADRITLRTKKTPGVPSVEVLTCDLRDV